MSRRRPPRPVAIALAVPAAPVVGWFAMSSLGLALLTWFLATPRF